ncbi:tRNA (adenosine(37)-N6)-threonylcarbamoyltransferase complex ATPase subunit type 1 TsaE [Coraliomargarita parva]|uniref:tRNA (adenosine(37)-N6)-threonylcarbamoyltransferase complex ATPase subunit type 1 TsaE n=1 Tax=Coraliomargarita parva TaxID=3014050 RepID=UPI0022B4CF2D|nr:tRNA (adenosine(37)-N6)-threonylcarbamoyltransferase complex ATPase subunit type 1 TsaE [Coraliomargarita parva]
MTSEQQDIRTRLRAGLATRSAAETDAAARALAPHIPEDHVLAFHGDLGAGKTTFIKGLARGWGISEAVTSPTFNLYTVYQGSRQLVHLDAYRLHDGSDLDSLMIEDFLQSPWCLAVEWPERITDSIPDQAWHLYLELDLKANCHRIRLDDGTNSIN